MSFKDKIFKNQSPWGTPPGGGAGGNGSGTRREPPNIDDVIKNLQKTYNGLGISILSTPRGIMSDNE